MNKQVTSKQTNVKFLYLGSPFTVDKSAEWGEGNHQLFPNGGWLKVNDDNTISHGVQSNDEKTAPVGWFKNENGSFDKFPIFVVKEVELGVVNIKTLDGEMNYDVKEKSYQVCNLVEGQPNEADSWIMSEKNLVKNYVI